MKEKRSNRLSVVTQKLSVVGGIAFRTRMNVSESAFSRQTP